MSTANRASLRAGVLGLMLGCIPAVWLVGWAAAALGHSPPNPALAVPPADSPAPLPPIPSAGGLQLGQFGTQLGMPVASPVQEELRSRFPFESLAKRLDYERVGRRASAGEPPAPQMTEGTGKRLAAMEEELESKQLNERTQKLILLHTDPTPQLPSLPAFSGLMYGGSFGPPTGMLGGSFGTFGLTREELELPPATAIPFAAVRAPSPGLAGDANAPRPPSRNQLAALHTASLFNFLDPAGFGYVKDREHVAGFEPHQFSRMPEMQPEWAGGAHMEKWVVVRLELVSLLKHDRPLVYVSDVLPGTASAERPGTRPLTGFEEKALKTLREGDDIATESSGDHLRMVGSLRAVKQCLVCHEVKRGDLLGAFSWELQRQTVDDDPQP